MTEPMRPADIDQALVDLAVGDDPLATERTLDAHRKRTAELVNERRKLVNERNAAITKLAEAQIAQTEVALELGDMEDQRNAVYRERAHLVALLAAHYPSHIGHTDSDAPDWAVVTIELPTGQACWHIAPGDMDLFAHVQPTPHDARPWDGHTTDEKYRRIRWHIAKFAGDVAALPHSDERPF